jgi:hypothetical protein
MNIQYASKLSCPFSLSFSFARNLTLLLCLSCCSLEAGWFWLEGSRQFFFSVWSFFSFFLCFRVWFGKERKIYLRASQAEDGVQQR